MDILNGFISGTDSNSKDIISTILILVFVLGFGKDTGFNLFNKVDEKNSEHRHKHKKKSFNSSSG